ncbi:MAG: carbohydrate ABC transporter permease [Bacteroidota bacterium]
MTSATERRVSTGRTRRTWLAEAYHYVLPAVAILLVVSLYPFIRAISISMHDFNLLRPNSIPFIGLTNFKEVLAAEETRNAFKVTVCFTFGSVTLELILGLLLAIFFNREFPGKGLARSLVLVPMILSPVVVGLVWRIFYDADAGMVNYFLSFLGFSPRSWLSEPSTALPALIFTDVWQWTPFCFVVSLAGLESLPREPFEAARIDGASALATFRYMTIPLMKPLLALAFIIRLIDSVKVFDLVFIMTNGGPGRLTETMNFLIYQTGFRFFHMGVAASQALLLTIVVTIFCSLFVRSLVKAIGGEDS